MIHDPAARRVVEPEHLVEVRLMQRPRRAGVVRRRADQITPHTARHFLRVLLTSDARRPMLGPLRSQKDVELKPSNGLKKRVEEAGELLACWQNELHGDRHEPRDVGCAARELALEVLAGAHA